MKKAIVIGGSSGIGYGLTQELLFNGYKVGVTGVEKDIIKDLQQENVKAVYLDCKIGDNPKVITELVDWLGGLDLLVFSAGIGNLNKDLGYSVENEANKLNVLAFTEIIDWTYRFFVKQRKGHLVAVTSISGLFGSRVAPAYHAAKAYQISYLEGFRQKAKKCGWPIHITDIRPGFVETPITEGKKVFWACTKEEAGKQILQSIKRKKKVAYVSRRWIIIATAIKLLPKFLRNRM